MDAHESLESNREWFVVPGESAIYWKRKDPACTCGHYRITVDRHRFHGFMPGGSFLETPPDGLQAVNVRTLDKNPMYLDGRFQWGWIRSDTKGEFSSALVGHLQRCAVEEKWT